MGERTQVESGRPLETKFGFCRAVRVDNPTSHIFIAGNASTSADGSVFAPGDYYANQARPRADRGVLKAGGRLAGERGQDEGLRGRRSEPRRGGRDCPRRGVRQHQAGLHASRHRRPRPPRHGRGDRRRRRYLTLGRQPKECLAFSRVDITQLGNLEAGCEGCILGASLGSSSLFSTFAFLIGLPSQSRLQGRFICMGQAELVQSLIRALLAGARIGMPFFVTLTCLIGVVPVQHNSQSPNAE